MRRTLFSLEEGDPSDPIISTRRWVNMTLVAFPGRHDV